MDFPGAGEPDRMAQRKSQVDHCAVKGFEAVFGFSPQLAMLLRLRPISGSTNVVEPLDFGCLEIRNATFSASQHLSSANQTYCSK